MSTSLQRRLAPGLRLLGPLGILGAGLAVSVALNQQWSTVLIVLALIGLGAGRSLFRQERWQLADDITTLRLGLIMVFTALILNDVGFSWPAVVVAAVALLLDACDGYVARRTRTTSAGGDFDESVDSLFILVLSIALVPVWGWWLILPGTFYYFFRGAALLRPALRRQLPPSLLRKTVAAAQGILLLTAGSPVALEYPRIGIICAAIALTALTFSFGRDILWLERHAKAPTSSPTAHTLGG